MILNIMAVRFLFDVVGPGGRDFSRAITNERVPYGDPSPVEYNLSYDTETQLLTIRHATREGFEPSYVSLSNIAWMREFPPPAVPKPVVQAPPAAEPESFDDVGLSLEAPALVVSKKPTSKPGKIVIAMGDDD